MSRRTNYNKKITEWSGNKIKVNEENGLITVAGKPFYTPEKTSTMSPQEQAFLIAGNLSAVFHDGGQNEPVWTNSENMLLIGEQPVMSLDGVAEADATESRLRDILSNNDVLKSELSNQNEGKTIKTKVKTKEETKAVKTVKMSDVEDPTVVKPMTMREKVEAYYSRQLK